MRFNVLATDYDGTLARHGSVDPSTIAALESLRASGRKAILVTGREIENLKTIFSRFELFDIVVGENGAVLYYPTSAAIKRLHEPPPQYFIDELRRRNVPVSVGHVIVSTREPHETVVLDVIKSNGLELEIIFNKGAVMILPSGVNKATGLKCAFKELGFSAEKTVAVGDAENDHAFLKLCGCAVAVNNALPSLKSHATFVTTASHGAGVTELINRLIGDDLAGIGNQTEFSLSGDDKSVLAPLDAHAAHAP